MTTPYQTRLRQFRRQAIIISKYIFRVPLLLQSHKARQVVPVDLLQLLIAMSITHIDRKVGEPRSHGEILTQRPRQLICRLFDWTSQLRPGHLEHTICERKTIAISPGFTTVGKWQEKKESIGLFHVQVPLRLPPRIRRIPSRRGRYHGVVGEGLEDAHAHPPVYVGSVEGVELGKSGAQRLDREATDVGRPDGVDVARLAQRRDHAEHDHVRHLVVRDHALADHGHGEVEEGREDAQGFGLRTAVHECAYDLRLIFLRSWRRRIWNTEKRGGVATTYLT